MNEQEIIQSTDTRTNKMNEFEESQETIDDYFHVKDMDAMGIAQKIDAVMIDLGGEAAQLVAKWFRKHGYFNGRSERFVDHDKEADVITCRVVVSCYGKPELTGLAVSSSGLQKRYPVDATLPTGWRWRKQ
jgi:hypothetical protein